MTFSPEPNLFLELGVKLACAMHNIKPEDLSEAKGFVDRIDDDPEGRMHKMAAASVAEIYDRAGRCEDFGYHLYVKLASAEKWDPSFSALMEPAYKALGDYVMRKQANPVSWVAKGLSVLPETATSLMLMSSLGGAGLGALNWRLNRDSTEDDEKTAIQKAKIEQYRKVLDEINSNLSHSGIRAA